MTENIKNAKEKILNAAIEVFAGNGFEGSRVDEIAKKAAIPKSLIYYHFKSKDEILEVLGGRLFTEYQSMITVSSDETHQTKAKKIINVNRRFIDFMIKNGDLLRIILIESLKKSNEKPSVFSIVESLITFEDQTPEIKNSKNYDKNERLIAEFFTNIIPSIAVICFRDSWIKYFKIDKDAFDKLSAKIISETHGAYHKNHE
jgi:AcrR family transcriptional regulator